MTSDALRACLKGVLMIADATREPAMDLAERIWPERKPPQPSVGQMFIERRKAA